MVRIAKSKFIKIANKLSLGDKNLVLRVKIWCLVSKVNQKLLLWSKVMYNGFKVVNLSQKLSTIQKLITGVKTLELWFKTWN